MTNIEKVAYARSALFVPGDRPERFQKAVNSGADIVILDLEDAVSPNKKDAALRNVIEALTSGKESLEALVRVNKDRLALELPALTELANMPGNGLLGVMFPKVETESDIPGDLGSLAVVALIESALGIENVSSIARADGLTRLAFGAVDFGADMGADHPTLLKYAQSRLLISSQAAKLSPPLDSPSVNISDTESVSSEASFAYKMGFGGKLCIHPLQVGKVHVAFQPNELEVAWAKEVLEAELGASQVGGKMVDLPVLNRARRILELVRTEM